MSKKDEKEAPAEAPKKSKKKKLLMIIAIAVVVLGGGGAGAFFMLKSDGAQAKPAPVKGIVTPLNEALTINLADGHYLKLNFALQETADAGTEVIDTSEAINLAIDEYTGKSVAELSTEKGRNAAKEELLAKIEKTYTEDGTQKVMDIYYTAFVTQ
jgi:flagellar FliL protein